MSKMYALSYKEWKESRYKLFNEKINHFSQYPEYRWLREYADTAMSANESFGLAMIAGTDFIERIECMPLDYIKDWLDHKNGLEWRECDRRMLKALKGGFAHLLGKYPNHVISRINISTADFYKKCGYEIITEGNNVYAIKEEN